MPLAALCRLAIDAVHARWRIVRLVGSERVHAPFRFELVAEAVHADGTPGTVEPRDLLSKHARLSWALGDGSEREVVGLIDEVEAVDSGFQLVVVPRAALLAAVIDFRVFVEANAVEIVTLLLREHRIKVENRVSRTPTTRAQCVQNFESVLGFISRILADEGVSWFLPAGRPDTVVLTDRMSGFDELEGEPLPVREGGGLVARESVYRAAVTRAVAPDKVVFRDYDFTKPRLDQTVEASVGRGALERFEYPGGYRDPEAGRTLAMIRLEELRANRIVLHGASSCRRLAPGSVVELASGGSDALPSRRWLLVDVEHEAYDYGAGDAGESRYEARFRAVPADGAFRPSRVEAPRAMGIQTATVTGPSGAEIHTDESSRLKLLLRFDRRRATDDTSSAWSRVVHPPTSGGFFLPRMGFEALIVFDGSSADTPTTLGRLANAAAPPPEGLPKAKVASTFGTRTTPGGSSANLVGMNDAAGSESFTLSASNDWNERTENDKDATVRGSDTWSVGGSRTLIVGQVHELGVGASQASSIAGSRTANVDANLSVTAASESVMVGGLRTFSVGGDYATQCASLVRLVGAAKVETGIEHVTRTVNGVSTVLVGGSWSEAGASNVSRTVLGASIELVGAAKTVSAGKVGLKVKGALKETLASRTVKAGGKRTETFGAAGSYTVGGSAELEGSDVLVRATAKITLKASGITVTITPGAIKIDGDFVGKVAAVDAGDERYE